MKSDYVVSILLSFGMVISSYQMGFSHNGRQKRKVLVSYLSFGILMLVVLLLSNRTGDYRGFPYLASLTYFSILAPRPIAILINLRQVKPPSLQLQINRINLVSGILVVAIALLCLCLAVLPLLYDWLTLQPHLYSYPGEQIDDEENAAFRLGMVGSIIPGLIALIMLSTQRITFCSEGIFYNGVFWSWRDFLCYYWKKSSQKEGVQDLVLFSQNFNFTNHVKLAIPSKDQEQINSFLEKKVRRAQAPVG